MSRFDYTRTTYKIAAHAADLAHLCSMCGPRLYSMRITQDVRDHAKEHGIESVDAALGAGMTEEAEEFKEMGGDLYQPA